MGINNNVNVVLEQQLMNINNTTVNAPSQPPPQPTGFYGAPQNYNQGPPQTYNPAYPPPPYPAPGQKQPAPYLPPQASEPDEPSAPLDEIARLKARLAEAELRAAANSKA